VLRQPSHHSVQQVELVVRDVAAARREIEAILAQAPDRSNAAGLRRGKDLRARRTRAAAKPASQGVAFHLGRVREDLLCYYVAADPPALERITAALARLRTRGGGTDSPKSFGAAGAICASTRPAAASRPKAKAPAPAPEPPAAPRDADADPYAVARLQRLLSPSQRPASRPAPTGATQPSAPAGPRLLLIKLRTDPALPADLDPGRNIRQ